MYGISLSSEEKQDSPVKSSEKKISHQQADSEFSTNDNSYKPSSITNKKALASPAIATSEDDLLDMNLKIL